MQQLERNLSIMAVILVVVFSLAFFGNMISENVSITGNAVVTDYCDEYYELWSDESWFDDWGWYSYNSCWFSCYSFTKGY